MTSDSQGLTSAGLRQCKRGETLLMCPNVKEFKTWFFSFPLSELTFMGEGRRRGAVQLPADLQWPALLLNLATCVIHNEMGGLLWNCYLFFPFHLFPASFPALTAHLSVILQAFN